MPFSSLLFVHVFLPAFLAVYWLTPRAYKNYTAIAASLVFYAWGAPKFLPVVLGLGVVDYQLSHAIGAARLHPARPRRAKVLLILGVTMHLSVLAYFKYSNFFVGQINELAGALGLGTLSWTHVVLPIGISFITFEEISYLCDVYRGDAKPSGRLSRYVLFLTLFPHSIAGPIFRWKDLEAQLVERTHSWQLAREGFERFSRGLAKKVLVADSVGIIVDGVFLLPADQMTAGYAWLGAVGYAIQIYFDFSGYSDMAIGLGKMIGFKFKENFNQPYIAASITEFWQRWHISLSSWLRDYLYVPLGGNRKGPRRALINVMIVFLLSGLWHGSNWTFVAWGAFHGVLVVTERVLGLRRDHVPIPLQHVLTFTLVVISWVFFRSGSLTQAGDMLTAMFGGASPTVAPLTGTFLPRHAVFALVLGGVIALAPILWKHRAPIAWRERLRRFEAVLRIGFFLLFVLSAVHMTNMRFTPLIYFKF
jgi:alginate O-acetyltransferase complex protein AlgI